MAHSARVHTYARICVCIIAGLGTVVRSTGEKSGDERIHDVLYFLVVANSSIPEFRSVLVLRNPSILAFIQLFAD